MNFGIGGDCTENILYRLQNGNMSKIRPKVVVLLIGTNNLNLNSNTPQETFEGVQAVIKEIHERSPDSKILLLGILPREEKTGGRLRTAVEETNKTSRDAGRRQGGLLSRYRRELSPSRMAPSRGM